MRKALLYAVVISPALFAGGGKECESPKPDSRAQSTFRVARFKGSLRVEILVGRRPVIVSPEEGLWSIATEWRNGWPAGWRHGKPKSVRHVGPWTVLEGEIRAFGGVWRVRDAYLPLDRCVKCVRRFEWRGPGAAEPCTLSVRFHTNARGRGVLLPGILYFGNPSGAKSGRVPVYEGRTGEKALFEEHRYPMPFASLEWKVPAESKRLGAALHTLPSPVPFANLKDQWWSLGVEACTGGTDFLLLSGPCASNGRENVIKAVQTGFVPYGDAYLKVRPGAVIEKTFFLEAYPVTREGSGFRRPLQTAIDLFRPFCLNGFPSFPEIIASKWRFAKGRWHETEEAAGFKKYPDRPFFVMGWCGQAAAPGYALQVLSDGLRDPAALTMVQKSLDFLATSPFYEGGFRTWYNYEKKEWSGHEPLSQGQALLNFARAVRVGRKGGMDTKKWEEFLRKGCSFHARRILKPRWNPRSTDEAFFIAPLAEASILVKEDRFLKAAVKAGEVYARRHLSMREPYWGGTLDASCEDKEGAYAAFQGFLALYERTREARFLRWAEHACAVTLTYTVIWDIDLPPGRLRDHGFRTRGWTVVSPQNQHIDVYGVLIAPDVYRLGLITNREDLKKLAVLMYRSCGQLIDPFGSQGEQPQHTNYAQRGRVDDIFALRGGYQETWTVFWITAHFLNAAARFKELGLDIWKEDP